MIDGDTIVIDEVLYDEGDTKLVLTKTVRMFGYNADEIHDKDPAKKAKGVAAWNFLANLLPTGLPVLLSAKKDEKYGRLLGTVFIADGRNANSIMLAQPGLVAPWDGTGPRPTV